MSAVGRNVGIVLVEYHSQGMVADRARHAERFGCSVVVADNSGSYDGPGTKVDTGGNVGFGAGCNRAVSALPAEIDVVVLQNPDATIMDADLGRLVGWVRRGWAAVAPGLVTPEYRPHGFRVPTLLREVPLVAREVAQRKWPGAGRHLVRPRRTPPPSGSQAAEPAYVEGRFGSGAFLALDRAWWDIVGGFDEHYFLYAEDLDLWTRLERAGGRVGFLPSVVVVHRASTGSPASVARRTVLRWIGRELWFERSGRDWRLARALHRQAVRLLPAEADEVLDIVKSAFGQELGPADTLARVRDAVLDP